MITSGQLTPGSRALLSASRRAGRADLAKRHVARDTRKRERRADLCALLRHKAHSYRRTPSSRIPAHSTNAPNVHLGAARCLTEPLCARLLAAQDRQTSRSRCLVRRR